MRLSCATIVLAPLEALLFHVAPRAAKAADVEAASGTGHTEMTFLPYRG
jgi:hypothetical protein